MPGINQGIYSYYHRILQMTLKIMLKENSAFDYGGGNYMDKGDSGKKHKSDGHLSYERKDSHLDRDSVDFDYSSKDYAIMEHMSNARLMPMTGPYGGLDLTGTYEYGAVPDNPSTPMEPYEVVMDKNTSKE